MSDYHYAIDDQKEGPVPVANLEALYRNGVITADTLVWTTGMPEWQKLGTVFPFWVGGASGGAEGMARCAVSGQLLPKAEMVQFGEQWVAAEHRATFLQRLQQGHTGTDVRFVTASLWLRIGANILDGLIIGLPAGLIVGLGLALTSSSKAQDDTLGIGGLLFIGFIVVGMAVYDIVMTKTKGGTVGKLVVGCMVIDSTGRWPSWGASIGRWSMKTLPSWIPLVGSLYWLVNLIVTLTDSDERRAIHDRVAGTRVVNRRPLA